MDSFRTFIAIELPVDLRRLVTEHINRLRQQLPEVRASWAREDNLHLTLKFLGNVPGANIPNVSDALNRATKAFSSFELTVSGCGHFPTRGQPNVLWIGAQAATLQSLHTAIERELAAKGFPREARAFHPHLTIARLRPSSGGRQLAEIHKQLGFAPFTFNVSEVVVFRSELLRQGSKHTALSRHALNLDS